MLERIAEVQGVGLLHDAKGKANTFRKATLIYGDNGRGKSTLASILRSVSTGDASLILHRKTLDGKLAPKVELQFDSGHKVTFTSGAWSERRPDVLVFDADFIERNVHSGGVVNTTHRKNLLEFALGEPAVTAQAAANAATLEAKRAADELQELTSQLAGHHVGTTLLQFEQLSPVPDANVQMEALHHELSAAANLNAISAKPVPEEITEPSFDIDALISVLQTSLQDIHVDAEAVVKKHLRKMGTETAEAWLSEGLKFSDGKDCPYCGQDIEGNDLIRAYQTHFNAAYADLKAKVSGLEAAVLAAASPARIEAITQAVATASAQVSAWADLKPIRPLSFNSAAFSDALAALANMLLHLVGRKQRSPVDVVGSSEDILRAKELWEIVLNSVKEVNRQIHEAGGLIRGYKARLAEVSTATLQDRMKLIQLAERRHDSNVDGLVRRMASARQTLKAAEAKKKAAREQLDKLMKRTLRTYEASINQLLVKFGAAFIIEGMDANFRGGAARSEYGLRLRGEPVALEGGPPSFSTTLSEGDKRTLAFAFFVASTMADAKLSSRTVVIDDPMCSLDANRRHHTKEVLKRLHVGAEQLVVLAHDPYFLRDVRDALIKQDATAAIASYQLIRCANDYTTFGAFNIDKECESAYFQHHRALNEFCDLGQGDGRSVAKAVRPMLEGYLHRRFPGRVPKSLMFGAVVTLIRDSGIPSPLVHAQNLVDELSEINSYVGQFHHDTNPDADTVVVIDSELKTYAVRALHIVHTGEPMA
ncbi:AAA family ATPase [Achromobacter spanius]|uniref:AAA family ATPase n=1 Tax=Achromobacter spanius TaxID=217203 RepID=UPI0038287830